VVGGAAVLTGGALAEGVGVAVVTGAVLAAGDAFAVAEAFGVEALADAVALTPCPCAVPASETAETTTSDRATIERFMFPRSLPTWLFGVAPPALSTVMKFGAASLSLPGRIQRGKPPDPLGIRNLSVAAGRPSADAISDTRCARRADAQERVDAVGQSVRLVTL
jgi:hypothetical protein